MICLNFFLWCNRLFCIWARSSSLGFRKMNFQKNTEFRCTFPSLSLTEPHKDYYHNPPPITYTHQHTKRLTLYIHRAGVLAHSQQTKSGTVRRRCLWSSFSSAVFIDFTNELKDDAMRRRERCLEAHWFQHQLKGFGVFPNFLSVWSERKKKKKRNWCLLFKMCFN